MERYKRQISLIGENGQEKLKKAKILVVGAGGIGNIAAKYLASSGVGRITIADGDTVDESNLNRQLLFNTESIGKNKAIKLCKTISKINPEILCGAYSYRITGDTCIIGYDLILDCTDNLETSYHLESEAIREGIPLIFAKTSKWFGSVTVIRSKYLKKDYPTNQLNTNNSVIPPIGGIIGSFQANLALKIILGKEISNKVFYFDILNDKFIQFDK